MLAYFVDSLVLVLLAVFLVLFVTQILQPIRNGGVLFPSFRRRARCVTHDLHELTTDEYILGLEEEAKALRTRLYHNEGGAVDGYADTGQHTAPTLSDEQKNIMAAEQKKNAAAASGIVDVSTFMRP